MKSKKFFRLALLVLALVLPLSLTACGKKEAETAKETARPGISTDVIPGDEYEEVTKDLIRMTEHDPELKKLLQKAVDQAKALNPDPNTNPVNDLESYYRFIDRCVKALPWEISPKGDYADLYERIDQGMGCLYFICDQPLEELEDKGYYHNSLMYHEPFRSWFVKFLSVSGMFLNTEASWKDEYYRNALEVPDFHLDDDTYESPDNWKSFNDFFARKLKDPSKRPIASPGDASVVVFPADSVPQGVWKLDQDSRVIAETKTEQAGLQIKTGTLTDVSVLLGSSRYADAFKNGTMTHTFLDVNDYHRYHFPVDGTVLEAFAIPQDDAPGGVITWDPEAGRYKEYFSEEFGWQSIETRGVVIVGLENGGRMAIVPVGMCQVSSVNFEETVVPGAEVKKGDPLGYFLFGGSDIVMIFSEDLSFELTAEAGEHRNMGNEYGRISLPAAK